LSFGKTGEQALWFRIFPLIVPHRLLGIPAEGLSRTLSSDISDGKG
jgi:hypothetical protein